MVEWIRRSARSALGYDYEPVFSPGPELLARLDLPDDQYAIVDRELAKAYWLGVKRERRNWAIGVLAAVALGVGGWAVAATYSQNQVITHVVPAGSTVVIPRGCRSPVVGGNAVFNGDRDSFIPAEVGQVGVITHVGVSEQAVGVSDPVNGLVVVMCGDEGQAVGQLRAGMQSSGLSVREQIFNGQRFVAK